DDVDQNYRSGSLGSAGLVPLRLARFAGLLALRGCHRSIVVQVLAVEAGKRLSFKLGERDRLGIAEHSGDHAVCTATAGIAAAHLSADLVDFAPGDRAVVVEVEALEELIRPLLGLGTGLVLIPAAVAALVLRLSLRRNRESGRRGH